jgi:hypothetical protein
VHASRVPMPESWLSGLTMKGQWLHRHSAETQARGCGCAKRRSGRRHRGSAAAAAQHASAKTAEAVPRRSLDRWKQGGSCSHTLDDDPAFTGRLEFARAMSCTSSQTSSGLRPR